jgi:hypothetical protein
VIKKGAIISKRALKLASLLGLIVLLLFVFWRIRQHMRASKDYVQQEPEQKITQDKDIPLSLKLNDQSVQARVLSEQVSSKTYEGRDEHFEEFDQAEQLWVSRVKEIIGKPHFLLYLELKKLNDEEKMLAYKEYHDYLRQKYGEHFSYNISEDQSLREKQINQRYLEKLLKIIGPDTFKSYTEAKDLFNESMRRQDKESIQVEF